MEQDSKKKPKLLPKFGFLIHDAQLLTDFVTLTTEAHGGGADRRPINRPINGLIISDVLCWILSWTKDGWDGGFGTSSQHIANSIGVSKKTVDRALAKMRVIGLIQPQRLSGGHRSSTVEYRYVDKSIVRFFDEIRRIQLAEKKKKRTERQRLIEDLSKKYDLHFESGRDFVPAYDRGPTHFRKFMINDDELSIAIFNDQNQQLTKNLDPHLENVENEISAETSKNKVAIFLDKNQWVTDSVKKISRDILTHNDNVYYTHPPASRIASSQVGAADAAPPQAGLREQSRGAVQEGLQAPDLPVGFGGAEAPRYSSFKQSIVGSNSGFEPICDAAGEACVVIEEEPTAMTGGVRGATRRGAGGLAPFPWLLPIRC